MLHVLLHGHVLLRRGRPGTPPATPQLHAPLTVTCLSSCAQIFMGIVLSLGGEWYLGVSKENAAASASACFAAAFLYLLYLVGCGLRVMKALNVGKGDAELLEDGEA